MAISQQQWLVASVALDEALGLAHMMPYPYAEAKAYYVYGLLQQTKGEREAAREHFTAALTILNRLGERLYAGQVERALVQLR